MLLTVDESREIADLNPETKYELRYGQLVEVALPKFNHQEIRDRLRELLSGVDSFGPVYVACGFRGTPEFDSRSADLGVISAERHRQAIVEDELFGAPDLVVEIISPSKTAGEMDNKEAFCLSHGCQSFWIVNPARRTVKVTDVNRHVQWFKAGDEISLEPFASGVVPVNQIFDPAADGKSAI